MSRTLLALLLLALPLPAMAELAPRPGWQVIDSAKTFDALVAAVKEATAANGMNVVTEAGPTAAAAKAGVAIPGNRVIGVFHVRFALRILPLSTAAMIEAPVRFYVTEDADGSATLAWKEPSFVFAPYAGEGGEELAKVAQDLDTVFAAIAAQATAD